jgi:hypothetical protein
MNSGDLKVGNVFVYPSQYRIQFEIVLEIGPGIVFYLQTLQDGTSNVKVFRHENSAHPMFWDFVRRIPSAQ